MRSMQLADSTSGIVLIERDIPRPQPGDGEVLIRVFAAGVTPTELAWFPSTHTKDGSTRTGAVPSHEFAGVVAGMAEGMTGLSPGQEIYGMNDWFAEGALAEYCLTRPEWIAPKPQRLSHEESASVPIGALTAWQGLYDRAQLQAGDRVLIHGGAGAVGVFAIQLARMRGANVTTTVSAHNFDFVKDLGANEAIDYRSTPFEQTVRDIDIVFDAVGGDTLARSWGVLKPNGRIFTVAANSETTSDERIRQAFFIVEPRRGQLAAVAKMLDAGELRAVVDTVVPFAQAADAYRGKTAKKRRGKVVVRF